MTTTRRKWPATDGQRIIHTFLIFLLWMTLAYTLHRMVLRPVLGTEVAGILMLGIKLVVIVWLGLHVLGGASAADLGLTTRGLGRDILLGMLGALGITAALLGYIALFSGLEAARETLQTILSYSGTERLGYLGVGISAAAIEEAVWRGYLQPALMRKLGFALGLVLTAVAFGLMHGGVFAWPPVRLFSIVTIGLVYGVLRGYDRPLTAPFVAHMATWALWGDA